MNDLTVDVGGYRVNLRVGAIVSHGDRVLLCRPKDKDWWYLPGGRIKANESSLKALQRELREEIGESFQIVRPLLCSENFFELDGHSYHEVCTYYDVRWLGTEMLAPRENQEIFAWVARKDVSKLDLKPTFLKAYVAEPRSNLELIIHRDGDPDAEAASGNG